MALFIAIAIYIICGLVMTILGGGLPGFIVVVLLGFLLLGVKTMLTIIGIGIFIFIVIVVIRTHLDITRRKNPEEKH